MQRAMKRAQNPNEKSSNPIDSAQCQLYAQEGEEVLVVDPALSAFRRILRVAHAGCPIHERHRTLGACRERMGSTDMV